MLNVIVAFKVWAYLWENKIIQINCDNLAVVEVLTYGKTKDEFLATCAINIWLISSIFNIQLRFSHIPGKYNNIADLFTKNPEIELHKLVPNFVWVHTPLDLLQLDYDI